MPDQNVPKIADVAQLANALDELKAKLAVIQQEEAVAYKTMGEIVVEIGEANKLNVAREQPQGRINTGIVTELETRKLVTKELTAQVALMKELAAAGGAPAVGPRGGAVRDPATGRFTSPLTYVPGSSQAEKIAQAEIIRETQNQEAAIAGIQAHLQATAAQQRAAGGWTRGQAPPPPNVVGGWAVPEGGRLPVPTLLPAPSSGMHAADAAAEAQALERQRLVQVGLSTSTAELNRRWNDSSAILSSFNNQLTKHGYLTSEVIQAAQRGELTYAEWGSQIAGTAAKFGAWTAVSIPIFGAIDAVKQLYDGAMQTSQGLAFMKRSLDSLNPDTASQGLRDLAAHFNVSIQDAANAVGISARFFHSQQGAFTAAVPVLYAEKLGGLDPSIAAQRFNGIAKAFNIPASDLQNMYGQVTQAQLRYGASIEQTTAALASMGGAWASQGGSLSQALALITAVNREGGNTVSFATAITQSIRQVKQPAQQNALASLGINPIQPFPQLLEAVVSKAEAHPELRNDLAAALGNARIFRTFPALLAHPQLLQGIEKTFQAVPGIKGYGGPQESELQKQLSGAQEQVKFLGTNLQIIGSSFVQSGLLSGAGGFLSILNDILKATEGLIHAFDSIPQPFRKGLADAIEIAAVLKGLRAINIGQGLIGPAGSFRANAHDFFTGDPTKRDAAVLQAQARENVQRLGTVVAQDSGALNNALTRARVLDKQAIEATARGDTALAEQLYAEKGMVVESTKVLEAKLRIDSEIRQAAVAIYEEMRVTKDLQAKINIALAEQLSLGAEIPALGTGAVRQVSAPTLGRGAAAASDVSVVGWGSSRSPLAATVGGAPRVASETVTPGGVVLPREVAPTPIAAASPPAPPPTIIAPAASAEQTSLLRRMEGKLGAAGSAVLGGARNVGGVFSGSFTNGLFSYFGATLASQIVAGIVGGSAGKFIGGAGQDAGIGAAIGTVVPGIGTGVGALGGIAAYSLGKLISGEGPTIPDELKLIARHPASFQGFEKQAKAAEDVLARQASRDKFLQSVSIDQYQSPYPAFWPKGVPLPPGGIPTADPTLGAGAGSPGTPQARHAQQILDELQYVRAQQQPYTAGRITAIERAADKAPTLQDTLGVVHAALLEKDVLAQRGETLTPRELRNVPESVRPLLTPNRNARLEPLSELLKGGIETIDTAKGYAAKKKALEDYEDQIDQSWEYLKGGTKGRKLANQAIGFLKTDAAGAGLSAGPEGFRQFFEQLSLQGQSGYDNYIKDTLGQQGLGAQAPGGKLKLVDQANIAISAQLERSRQLIRQSLQSGTPGARNSLVQRADAYAKEAANLVGTLLGQNDTDLANALTLATNQTQVAAAFDKSIAFLRNEERKHPTLKNVLDPAIRGKQQQKAQNADQFGQAQLSLQDTYDPLPLDVLHRTIQSYGAQLKRDIAAFGKGSLQVEQDLQAQAQAYQTAFQGVQAQFQQGTDLAISQTGGDPVAAAALQASRAQQNLDNLNNSKILTPKQKAALRTPLVTARNNDNTASIQATYDYNSTKASGEAALAVAQAGNDPVAAAQANVTAAKAAIAALEKSGLAARVIAENLPQLEANLLTAVTGTKQATYDYNSTKIAGETALAVARAGNNRVAADRAGIAGARAAIANLLSSGQSARVIAAQMPQLQANLANAITQANNDIIDVANGYATAMTTLKAGAHNDPMEMAKGVLKAANDVIKRGHFKTPTDKVNAEIAQQSAQFGVDTAHYDRIEQNMDLANESIGQRIQTLQAFYNRIKKKDHALARQVAVEIHNDELQAAGGYELSVGNLSLPTAYAVRRSEHALFRGHDQNPIHVGANGITININGAGDPVRVGRETVKAMHYGVRGQGRAAMRSNLFR